MSMEIKINKDIGEYTEKVFFGLTLRQCIFSSAAVGVAALVYFALRSSMGVEEVSWVCILSAAPFAACAFFRIQGLTLEKFVLVWLKSEFLLPKRLLYVAENGHWRAVVKLRKKEREKQTVDRVKRFPQELLVYLLKVIRKTIPIVRAHFTIVQKYLMSHIRKEKTDANQVDETNAESSRV